MKTKKQVEKRLDKIKEGIVKLLVDGEGDFETEKELEQLYSAEHQLQWVIK